MLSRFGPLGLSVLSLIAAFVIVLTAGGVLATSSNPATPAPTPTRAPRPTTVTINIAALQAGRDVDVPEGVRPSLRISAPPPLAGATPTSGPGLSGGQGVALLCLTLSDRWTLWDPSHVWTKDGKAYCRAIDPQQPEIKVVLGSTR